MELWGFRYPIGFFLIFWVCCGNLGCATNALFGAEKIWEKMRGIGVPELAYCFVWDLGT